MTRAVRLLPSVLHVDVDAFYASVEQRDKPSLRGRPVVVGGTGARGVVATASYEARAYGIGSAMSTAEARGRCAAAAVLAPRFAAYAAASAVIMALLRELSPLVEPLSLDEAFVDLAAGTGHDLTVAGVTGLAAVLKERVHRATGLRISVGAGTSKLVAKIGSDLDKPDGLVVVPAGTETALLWPLAVTRLWGVGPATAGRLRGAGVTTIGELAATSEAELVGLLGQAHGSGLWRLAHARDERGVVAERETKSVSAEDTFERDLTGPALLAAEADRLSARVVARMRADGLTGRTVTLKLRRHDFTTVSRSTTLPGPTDDLRTVVRVARRLLAEVDVSDGVRLLGVGLSGLTDWAQNDLFDDPSAADAAQEMGRSASGEPAAPSTGGADVALPEPPRWAPGQDVVHEELGRGWVWGAGAGRVSVRFEDRHSPVGPVRTFAGDDPALQPAAPLPEDAAG